MSNYSPKTKHGHDLFEISSMLQKSIRRGDIDHAGYAAMELFGNYEKYLWKRLLTVSAEDCYGIMTKEIVGLKMASDIVNEGRKGYDRDYLFVAKAVTLLCMARKNRDGCYVACNFMYPERILEPEEIKEVDISNCKMDDGIPDWVFDIHTLKGRQMGKTDLDMTIDEQEALEPKQLSLFDNASWQPYHEQEKKLGHFTNKEWRDIINFMEGKEADPTHNGKTWLEHSENWG